jgi:mono/diheme cytochrome c family protein
VSSPVWAAISSRKTAKKIGGPISVNLYNAGQRYNLDWLFRFALNPQDFNPHSGEYLADITPRQLRHLMGFLMVQGVDDYKYFEPWNTQAFKNGEVSRGRQVYKEYCVQCHGPKGDGDGVGSLGLTDPPPAKHSQMALSEIPDDYLYNVIFYGGKSVGKSPNMPDWGMTLSAQQLGDLNAYLRDTFKGGDQAAAASSGAAGGDCVQDRKTKSAPPSFLNKKNPLPASASNIRAGEKLFMKDAKPVACMQCHGKNADGNGPLGGGLSPKPRNFSCGSMMAEIPDGQLFYIIKNGSAGTGMMPFPGLKDDQVWKLIHYIRSVAK